jgi:hypothetical protein
LFVAAAKPLDGPWLKFQFVNRAYVGQAVDLQVEAFPEYRKYELEWDADGDGAFDDGSFTKVRLPALLARGLSVKTGCEVGCRPTVVVALDKATAKRLKLRAHEIGKDEAQAAAGYIAAVHASYFTFPYWCCPAPRDSSDANAGSGRRRAACSRRRPSARRRRRAA